MVTVSFEEDVVRDLYNGLSLAVKDCGLSDPGRYLNETKIHKLLYYAVDEFDLPVTYSWYLAGAHIAPERVSLEDFEQSYESVNRNFSSGKFVDNRTSTNLSQNVNEYRAFYKKVIERIWFTELNEFLREFYREEAPEEYKSLYLKSLDLRVMFKQAIEDFKETSDTQKQASLSQFSGGTNNIVPDYHDEYTSLVEDIQLELANNSTLNHTTRSFNKFRIHTEPVIQQLCNLDSNEINRHHITILEETNRLYFMHAWQYPCLFISQETAVGPHKKDLIQEMNQRIEKFESNYERQIEYYTEKCIQSGIEIENIDRD
ncbi:hypothetical protein HTG_18930 [Natrinema mahii]|nr:hypothetical protein HTG_18930 [Natrinema mahii]